MLYTMHCIQNILFMLISDRNIIHPVIQIAAMLCSKIQLPCMLYRIIVDFHIAVSNNVWHC